MSASAADGPKKVDKLLEQSTSGSGQPVIIRVNPEAKERLKARLPRRGRGPVEHNMIGALTAVMDRQEIAALASDPDVLSVSADADVTSSAAASSSDGSTASLLKKSLGLQDWFAGSSMAVAVIDSGIQNIPDFNGRILGMYDFTNGRNGVETTPLDEYGHGTHVAGLIGSSGASSNGKYAGVAPGIKLLSLKVLDKKGSGRTSSVIAALEFAVANKGRFNIRVINLSLGHPIYESAATDPLVQAVEAAVRSGIIVVAAAGNYGTNPSTGLAGYGGIASPGNAPSAITVGASTTAGTEGRSDDRVAAFSSRGPSWYDGLAKPDIVAPGSNLISNNVTGSTLSTVYPSLVLKEGSSKYLKLNGSSMASAVVSGLVAVMIEANNYGNHQRWQEARAGLKRNRRTSSYPGAPALTPNALKAMLQYSATKLRDANGTPYDALTQGSGEANGLGALVLAYYTDTTKPAGSYWMTATLPPSTTFGGVEEEWAQHVIWGTRPVTGSSIIELNQAAWDDNIVWGTGEIDNIVWGTVAGDTDNIVWGTSASWGDNIVWGTLSDDNIVWGTSENNVTVLGASIGGGL